MSHMNILILGAGEIGRAIAHILRNRTEENLTLWDKNSDRVPGQQPLDALVPSADIIFICVPSVAIRNALTSIAGHMSQSAIVVTLTKGIERETCKTTDKLIEEMLPSTAYAILSGPMLAEELLQDSPGAALVGTRNVETYSRIAEVFADTKLSVSHSRDPQSVALCGVLKNIYSVALGVIEATGDGANMRGIFFTKAIDEMTRVLRHLGAAPDVAYGIAGLGDLVATATSPYSRNRIVGEELGLGKHQNMESEGLGALPCIPSLLGTHRTEFPILDTLCRIAHDGVPAVELAAAVLLPFTAAAPHSDSRRSQ